MGSLPLWPWLLTLTFGMDTTSVNSNIPRKFQDDAMKHCKKDVTDGQTERSVLRAAWLQLKIYSDLSISKYKDSRQYRLPSCGTFSNKVGGKGLIWANKNYSSATTIFSTIGLCCFKRDVTGNNGHGILINISAPNDFAPVEFSYFP